MVGEAIYLVYVFPYPSTDAFLAFYRFSVLFFYVGWYGVAFVRFRFFVRGYGSALHAYGYRGGHVRLLTRLISQRARTFVGYGRAYRATRYGSASVIGDGYASGSHARCVASVSGLHVRETRRIHVDVYAIYTRGRILVRLFRFYLAFFFVARCLRGLLTIRRFFGVSISLAGVLLLLGRVFSALSNDFLYPPSRSHGRGRHRYYR